MHFLVRILLAVVIIICLWVQFIYQRLFSRLNRAEKQRAALEEWSEVTDDDSDDPVARQEAERLYNEAAASYNEAISKYPGKLIALLFTLKPINGGGNDRNKC